VLLSCNPNTIEEVELPFEKEKLVVNCYFSADSVWDVRVWNSTPTFSAPKFIDDAMVVVTDGITEFPLTLDKENLTYRSIAKAEAGKRYTLKVSAPGYETATSTATVPPDVPVLDIRTSLFRDPKSPESLRRRFDIRIKDPSGQENYYAIAMFKSHFIPHPPYEGWIWSNVYLEGPDRSAAAIIGSVAFRESYTYYKSGTAFAHYNLLFDDSTFDGREHVFTVEFGEPAFPEDNENAKSMTYRIYFKTLTEEYYKYRITANQQKRAIQDPFAAPVHVFSNIENGFGIFAPYNMELYEYKVR
jgi:hypothetical protein